MRERRATIPFVPYERKSKMFIVDYIFELIESLLGIIKEKVRYKDKVIPIVIIVIIIVLLLFIALR